MANIIPLKFLKNGGGQVLAPSELNPGDTIPDTYLNAQPIDLYGTYATRPAANTVKANTAYYASDTLECYRSNGTAWALAQRGGAELGFGERTSPFAITVNTFTDLPGLAFDYIAGEGAAFVQFGATGKTGAAATTGVVAIFVDGVQSAQILYTSTTYQTMSMGIRVAGKTPGATVQIRVRVRQANAPTQFDIFGDAVDRPYVRGVTG